MASSGILDERKEHSNSPPEAGTSSGGGGGGGVFSLGTPALGGQPGRDSPTGGGAGIVRALQASAAAAAATTTTATASASSASRSSPQLQAMLPLRSPRLGSLLSTSASAASLGEAGAGAGAMPAPSPRGRVSPSSSALVMGSPMQRPVPRVDSDDQLYSQAVSWEVDPEEIDFSRSSKVGQGSHGEVYRAKWRGTPIAVKQLATSGVSGASALGEMRHEIAVLAHMHHPRVVQFLGACTKGRPLLVLSEFLRGGSVAQTLERLKGERLPPAVAGRWALDAAQGLRYLHEHKPQPVVHRDLKPQNLLVDGSCHVKISDFGLAKVVDQLKALDERYVMTGETGSYRYMAPEVFRHERYSEKVDIYALGVVIFQMTSPTGEPPLAWLGAVAAAEAMSLRHERPEMSPKLAPRLRSLITSCWHPDATKRPSAAHVCAELEQIYPDAADDGNCDGGALGVLSAEAALAAERSSYGGAAPERAGRGGRGGCSVS